MRLKKIKLSGFKSFVDPTTIDFPSQLVGVVGPNGCGKSNVIDAVRWVLGESSAKQLRGDSMDDVIFNGSSVRKPVGQASVELLFDNCDGGLGGQYASYSEISVRRVLARDGPSTYSLNGSRCRRRDITDIFLGTGLGPRSYAIIEQGTISRLVEAKPDELRVFLEEAAGISRYKDRRRETELRIRDTKENLARITDVIGELEKRLQTLQRQARTAARYQEVCQEKRLCKAQLLVLRWQYLDVLVREKQGEIAAQETCLERHIAEFRAVEAEITQQHERQAQANERLSDIQGQFYRAGAHVARVEQAIQHLAERQTQYRQELDASAHQVANLAQALGQDGEKIEALEGVCRETAPRLTEAQTIEQDAEVALGQAELRMTEWQQSWDQSNQVLADLRQTAKLEGMRIQHHEGQLEQTRARHVRLASEMQALTQGIQKEQEPLRRLKAAERDASLELETVRQEMSVVQVASDQLRQDNQSRVAERDRVREALQVLRQEDASLTALQNAALGKEGNAVGEWIQRCGLTGSRRLAEVLDVDAGWETAVECVLAADLQGLCIDDDVAEHAGSLSQLERGKVTLLEQGDVSLPRSNGLALPRLLEKVTSPWRFDALLAGVYVCDTLEEALSQRLHLAAGESIVTRAGLCLGRNWLRLDRGQEETGVLLREQRLRVLSNEMKTLEAQFNELHARCQRGQREFLDLESRAKGLQTRLAVLLQGHASTVSGLARLEATLEQSAHRLQALQAEMAELDIRSNSLDGELRVLRENDLSISARVSRQAARHGALGEQRDGHCKALDDARQALRCSQTECSRLMTRIETTQASLAALRSAQKRVHVQRQEIQERTDRLQRLLIESEAPTVAMQSELQSLISGRMDIEQSLVGARQQAEALDHRLKALIEQHKASECQVDSVRSDLGRQRLSWQEEHVRRQTVQEQLSETDLSVDELIKALPEGANEAEWQDRIAGFERRIQRMGPINLAAIDECQEQVERKGYLDAQSADLCVAMETLDRAIQKIDNETKQRFRDTFDRVNERLSDLYPRLFGGGKAYLEMIGDEILDAGVLIVARPPGKRNSSIYQLSGGEKALTAVALVFAFFELNPAPFCMLDEVDAPLDDNNASRFCQLVKAMSAQTQFIFITHNKIAMEMGQQLLGVTMHEPGVSRLVAVDMEAAAEMAATA